MDDPGEPAQGIILILGGMGEGRRQGYGLYLVTVGNVGKGGGVAQGIGNSHHVAMLIVREGGFLETCVFDLFKQAFAVGIVKELRDIIERIGDLPQIVTRIEYSSS